LWVLLVAVLSCAAGLKPGLEVIVGQSALSEINILIDDLLPGILHEVKIPNQQGKGHIPVLGSFNWWLDNVKIEKFQLGHTNTTIASHGLVEQIPATGTIYITAEYRWKHESGIIHYSDHGTVDIDIDQVGFIAVIDVGAANDRPTVQTPGVQFHLGNLHIKFHGKISWVYDFLTSVFHGIILHEINSQVPNAVNQAINVKAEEALQKLQVRVPWKETIIDLSLLAPPYFSPGRHFEFALLGEFQDREHPSTCPHYPNALPDSQNREMLQVYVDDYVPNCALDVFYKQGIFKKVIDEADLPEKFQPYLNTSEYWLLLPPLYQKYPNMEMEIIITAAAPPITKFLNPNISGTVVADITFYVVPNKTSNPIEAFTLSAGLSASLTAAFKPQTTIIYGSIQSLDCNITLASTNIGPLNIVPLVDAVLEPLCHFVPTIANQFLAEGIEIPSELGFTLVDPQITVGKGYLGISSSLKYSRT